MEQGRGISRRLDSERRVSERRRKQKWVGTRQQMCFFFPLVTWVFNFFQASTNHSPHTCSRHTSGFPPSRSPLSFVVAMHPWGTCELSARGRSGRWSRAALAVQFWPRASCLISELSSVTWSQRLSSSARGNLKRGTGGLTDSFSPTLTVITER